MTIVFFARLFYPHIGGVEKHVLKIGKRLVEKGYKVVVVAEETYPTPMYQSKNKSAKFTEYKEGIQIYRIPVGKDNWFKKFRIWRWLWNNKKIIQEADIIHCHDVFFWYLPFRFLYPKKPVYTTFHGYETNFPPFKKSIMIRKISEKLSWGNICIGNYIKKWYGTKPTFVTYGGVEISDPKHTIPKKYKILFIGRLEEDTGVHIFLKTLEMLKNKINFEFEACGDGSLRSVVEQYGKVNGFIEDLSSYIKNASIIFASSYLSILESIGAKKMVFTVYQNQLKEDYLKMSAFGKFIIIENNPERLVKKILFYKNHLKITEKMLYDGHNWAKQQTWDKVTDLYIKLWNSKFDYS